MNNQLTKLKHMTTVVTDTDDIDAVEKFKPQDPTTTPSLLWINISSSSGVIQPSIISNFNIFYCYSFAVIKRF